MNEDVVFFKGGSQSISALNIKSKNGYLFLKNNDKNSRNFNTQSQ
jgi:hypothetical protein